MVLSKFVQLCPTSTSGDQFIVYINQPRKKCEQCCLGSKSVLAYHNALQQILLGMKILTFRRGLFRIMLKTFYQHRFAQSVPNERRAMNSAGITTKKRAN